MSVNMQRRTLLASGLCLSSLASMAYATGQSPAALIKQQDWIEGVLRKHIPQLPKNLPMIKEFSAQVRNNEYSELAELKTSDQVEIFVLVQFSTQTNYLQWAAGETTGLKLNPIAG